MPIYKMEGKKDGLQKYRVRINYTDRDGKSKQLDRVAYGREAAKDLERQLTLDLKTGEATTSRMTVQQLFNEYIAVKAGEARESTINTSRKQITNYIIPYLGNNRIDKLNPQSLQKWKLAINDYVTRKGSGLSVVTKQNIYGAFSNMLKYAVRMEYIPKNPLSLVGNFKDAYSGKTEMEYYTPEQFKKYIAVAREKAEESEQKTKSVYDWNYYVFFNIAFYTGMRKGEIGALKWTDIEGDTIHVTRSITQKLKGDDRETPPKNKSSIRNIQMPKPLIKALTEHKNRCKALSGFSEDWRICGGEKSLRDTTVQKRNTAYAKEAGLKQIRIHDFRHSHASVLANEGINIQEIARRLGHSNVETTWNTYSHMYPREEERAVEILNKIV